MAAEDLVALYKEKYSDQIKASYQLNSVLTNCITIDTGEATGVGKLYPLVSARRGYTRSGGEMIQPKQSKTANVEMKFTTFEDSEMLPYTERAKIDSPTYIPTITKNISNSIIQLQEQAIINALALPATIKASAQTYDNIEYALQLMGDGSNRAADKLAEADLKEFSFDCLIDIKTAFDNMGVAMGDRYLYLDASAIKVLLKDERFTNSLYTDKTLAMSNHVYTSTLGLTIMQAQMNPEGGLPRAKLGSTNYVTNFAFTRDAVVMETNSGTPIADMWDEKKQQSLVFLANMTCGVVTHVRPKTIQIPTKLV